MTVKILTIDNTHDDDTIIAVCIANYLIDRGVNNNNINIIKVLEKVLDKLPQKTKSTITETFKLEDHFNYLYTEKDNTEAN